MNSTCPYTGEPIARTPVNELVGAPLSVNQQEIVNILARAYPRRVLRDALIEALYANDPDGGPETAIQTLRTQISYIRKKLSRFGWTIPNLKSGTGEANYCFYSLAPAA